jgi:cleavage and polyadenylation specificity factor subunit 1
MLQIFSLPGQKLVSVIEGIDSTQPILSSEPPKRLTAREPLVEAVVADLGDSWSSHPYLIVWVPLHFPYTGANQSSYALRMMI